jgi:hypothetical protein
MPLLPAALVVHAKVVIAITATTAVAAGGGYALSTKVGDRGDARNHAVVLTTPEPTDPADDDATESPETEPTEPADDDATESPETEPTDDPADEAEAGDDESAEDPKDTPDEEAAPDACPPGLRNHGEYVSMIAKLAPKSPAGAHGKVVSEAAKSDCGKKAKHDEGDDDDQGEHDKKGDHHDKGESHKDGKKTENKVGKPHKSHEDKGKRGNGKGSEKR